MSVIVGSTTALVFWLVLANKRNVERRRARGATGVLVDLSLENESKWEDLRLKQEQADRTEQTAGTAIGDQGLLDL